MHPRRDLVAALYWLDRMPACRLRWELEALVLELLAARRSSSQIQQALSAYRRISAGVACRNQNEQNRGTKEPPSHAHGARQITGHGSPASTSTRTT